MAAAAAAGAAGVALSRRARMSMTANTITGTSIATRISLTKVATSPVSLRHAVAGADHLRHVVDRGAEEDAGQALVQPDGVRQHRIDDHRHRRQRRDADHGEQRRALLERMRRQRGRQRQRRRGAADRGGAAAEQAEQALKAHQPGHQHRHADRQHDRDHDDRHRLPAELGDLAERDAQAEQGDADAQHLARGELDAGGARAFARQEVHRHAEQQGEQHDRRAVVLGEEGRGRGDNRAGQHAREQLARLRLAEGNRQCNHGRPGFPVHDANAAMPVIARPRISACTSCVPS